MMRKALLGILLFIIIVCHIALVYYLEDPNQLSIANGLQMAVYRMSYQYNHLFKTLVLTHFWMTSVVIIGLLIIAGFIRKVSHYIVLASTMIVLITLFVMGIRFFYIYFFIILIEFAIYLLVSLIFSTFQRKCL